MQLSAILLARVIGFIELNDLNPRGRVNYPMVVPLLIDRFKFAKYPQKAEDFDEQKGIDFSDGHSGEVSLDKLTIWHNGVGLDVRSSTDDARGILDATLNWLKKEAGLTYSAGMIKRWAY